MTSWLQISCRYVAEISSVGILAPNYVCLDTKIMILSELEAEILKNLYFGRPFWKMAAISTKKIIQRGPISISCPNTMYNVCTKFHACITKCTITSYFGAMPLYYKCYKFFLKCTTDDCKEYFVNYCLFNLYLCAIVARAELRNIVGSPLVWG